MAKTIFAGKQVEKFTLEHRFTEFGFINTKLP